MRVRGHKTENKNKSRKKSDSKQTLMWVNTDVHVCG